MTTSGPDFYHDELEPEHIAALLESRALTANEVVEGLWHGSALVRRNAARGARFVADLPDPGEVMLRIASKDPDEGVRSAVVSAVATGLGAVSVAMPILFDAVLDKGEGIRDTAISGLELRLTSQTAEAMPFLVAALADLRPAVSAVASQLLIKVGGFAGAVALIPLLGHGDANRRRGAFDVLDRVKWQAIDELIAAMRDAAARPLVMKLIAGLGDVEPQHKAALESYLTEGSKRTPGLAGAAGAPLTNDAKLVEAVTKLLGELGRVIEVPRSTPIEVPIAGFLERKLSEEELLSADLGAVSLEELFYGLRDGRDPVRQNCAHALGLHPGALADEATVAKVVSKLAPVVRDAAADVREAVVVTLGRLIGGPEETIALLVKALEDASAHVRQAAVEAIAAHGTNGLVNGLAALHVGMKPTVAAGLREVGARLGTTVLESLADALSGTGLSAVGREVAASLAGDFGSAAEPVIPALIRALRDPIEDVRAAAATALGFVGLEDPIIIEDLRRLLADPVPAVRRAAALAAARITGRPLDDRGASDPRVVPIDGFESEILPADRFVDHGVSLDLLLHALRDGRDTVKINAARAIGALGASGEGAAQPLAVLLRDAEVDVRLAAVDAYRGLGKAGLAGAWFLTTALNDPDARVREGVVEVLVELFPEAADFLIEALRGDTAAARVGVFNVWYRLAQTGVPSLGQALNNGSPLIRLNAALALELLARRGADEALDVLELKLADPIGRVRAAAQAAIDAIKGGKPKPPKVLEPDPVDIHGFDERVVDPGALEEARLNTTAERMIRALRDGRPYVRENAVVVLAAMAAHGEAEPQTLVPALAVAMRDGTTSVRKAAARALGRVATREVGPVLVHALEDKNEEVREAARSGLMGLGTAALPSLVEGLLRLASLAALPAEERVRRSVLPLMTRLANDVDTDAVVSALAGALGLDSAPIRAGALNALRHIGRERAEALRTAVIKLESDSDAQVAREARATHDHLDGKDVAPAAAPALPLPPEMVERVLSFDQLGEMLAAAGGLEINLVLKATQDGREVVRQNAARTVALLADPPKRAAMALAILLRDADVDVRRAAAETLDRCGPAFAAPVGFWLTVALQDSDLHIRDIVTNVLAAVHDIAPEALVEGLRVDPDLAHETILIVVDRLGRPAVPTLEAALSNGSGLIRLNAARGLEILSKRGADQALDALKAKLNDPIGQVRIAAQAAIDAVQGGKPRPLKVLEPDPVAIPDFTDRVVDADLLEAARDATTAERMVRALNDGRPFVRHNAAVVLGAMVAHGEVDAGSTVAVLSVAARDSIAFVRQAAVTALARVGSGEGASLVVVALEDRHKDVRAAARAGLISLGTTALAAMAEGLPRLFLPSSLPPEEAARLTVLPVWVELARTGELTTSVIEGLMRAATSDSPLIRAGALRTLRFVGRERAEAARDAVVLAESDNDELVAREAKATRDHLDGKDVLPAAAPALPLPDAMVERVLSLDELLAFVAELEIDVLLKATQDGREIVRQNAARLVGLVEDPPKRAAMSLAMLLRDGEVEVRQAAAQTLARRGAVFAAPVGQWLTAALKDPDAEVRDTIVNLLRAVHEEAPEAIIEGLRLDPDEAHETILVVVDRIGNPAVPTLEKALSNASGLIRMNAAQGLELLAQRGADEAMETLEARLSDPIVMVRRFSQAAIDAIKGGKPRPPRVREPDPVAIAGFDERIVEADILESSRHETTAERMVRALNDGRAFVRQNAAVVLGAMVAHGEVEAGPTVGLLAVAARDSIWGVRQAAVTALGRVASGEGASLVVTALEDKLKQVREAARIALVGLGSNALPALTEGLPRLFAPSSLPPEEAARQTVVPVWVELARQADAESSAGVIASLANACGNESPLIRAGALRTLRLVGRERAEAARDAVVRAEADNDELVVREARATRDHLDGKDVLPAAAPALPLPDAMVERALSLDELRAFVSELEVDVVLKATQDGRELVRQNAARLVALLENPPKRAAMSLAMLLRDGEADVRRAAAQALSIRGAAFAAPVGYWLAAALKDPDADIRDSVVNVLCAVHEEAPEALIEGLRVDPDDAHDTILVVVDRLANKAVPTLEKALSNASGLIRMNAAQGLELLSKRGADAAIEALESRLTDPIGMVRRFSQAAIDAIKGGKPRPPRVIEPDPIEITDFSVRLLDEEVLATAAGTIAFERLVRALSDGRAWVRANAATLLGLDSAYRDVGPLAVLAKDGVAVVRARTVTALGRLALRAGGAIQETAATVVSAALSDRHESVRGASQSALAALGVQATTVLVKRLADVSGPSPLLAALVGLFHAIGDEAVASVALALGPNSPELHVGALLVLHSIASAVRLADERDSVEKLAWGDAGTGAPQVRDAATALLDKIDGKDIAPVALDPIPLPLPGFADGLMAREVLAESAAELRLDLLTHAMSDGRDVVRANAVTGLEVLGSAQQVALPMLVRALRDSSIEVRVRSAEAIATMPPRRDVAFELVNALSDASPRVVSAAEHSLGRFGEFALDAFMYALDDAPNIVGRNVLPMLAQLGEKALDAIVLAQRYDSPLVRRNALTALRLMDKDLVRAVRPAVALSRRDEEREVRLEALRVLEWIDGIEHIMVREPRPLPSASFATEPIALDELASLVAEFDPGILEDLLLDGRRHVRENACTAFGVLGRYHAWLPIRLKDDSADVQVAAATTLLSLGELAVPAAGGLIEALSEDDDELRAVARAALEGLGAQALPALVTALWAPADVVRKTVVPIIEKLGKEATPAIITALDHPSQLVVLNALFVLARLYGQDPDGAVKGMAKVTALTRHTLPAIIGAAQKCLFRLEGRTPAEFQKDAVPMPITGFDKGPLPDEILRANAASLDLAWMISAFSDGRPVVRENAARAAGFMPAVVKDLLGPLTIALKDGVPEVQVAAADAFASLVREDEVAIAALTFALKNATERVKRACMVALDVYGPERVAKVLVNHLVGREDWMLVTIGRVAARMSEVLVPALMAFAKRREASLIARENAVKIIGDLSAKARGVEDDLLTLLPEMEGMLACKAAFAIGRVARPNKVLVEKMLKHLTTDPRPSMHKEVRDAVKAIKRRMPVGG